MLKIQSTQHAFLTLNIYLLSISKQIKCQTIHLRNILPLVPFFHFLGRALETFSPKHNSFNFSTNHF